MSLLVISPDFASHYNPLAVLATAARDHGRRVVVATGPTLRQRVQDAGFEWSLLPLGASSNRGIASCDSGLTRFIAATRDGPIATIRRQALERERDLLWEPERVALEVADVCDRFEPEHVLVDHVSFGSTLAMYATGRPFLTLIPGHPSQLPVGAERYGIPATWPARLRPDLPRLDELDTLVDRVTRAFTTRWNAALATVAPGRPPVDDAFRVHGERVLYNSVGAMQDTSRAPGLPVDHSFVGPLVRDEHLPSTLTSWSQQVGDRPRVVVALGTFLSHRSDVLVRIANALLKLDVRVAIASGATPQDAFGQLPDDWVVAPQLPQVAMLAGADLFVHHGGNNSVQEALAAGVRQVVLPFSTDQFSNAADLERIGSASVLPPNEVTVAELAQSIDSGVRSPPLRATPAMDAARLVEALFG
jgi:UDP:flavonoid glycosyltransferase YjiC (YdhE family)